MRLLQAIDALGEDGPLSHVWLEPGTAAASDSSTANWSTCFKKTSTRKFSSVAAEDETSPSSAAVRRGRFGPVKVCPPTGLGPRLTAKPVIVEPACLAHVDVKPDPMVARVHGHDEVVLARTYSHVTLDQLRDADQSVTSRAAK